MCDLMHSYASPIRLTHMNQLHHTYALIYICIYIYMYIYNIAHMHIHMYIPGAFHRSHAYVLLKWIA